jgi:hypothetical protein
MYTTAEATATVPPPRRPPINIIGPSPRRRSSYIARDGHAIVDPPSAPFLVATTSALRDPQLEDRDCEPEQIGVTRSSYAFPQAQPTSPYAFPRSTPSTGAGELKLPSVSTLSPYEDWQAGLSGRPLPPIMLSALHPVNFEPLEGASASPSLRVVLRRTSAAPLELRDIIRASLMRSNSMSLGASG